MTELVTGQQHRHALRQEQSSEKIALLPAPQRIYRRVVGWTFDAAIPTIVLIRAIAVVLPVGFVVLALVADEIAQRKAVMAGHKIHACAGPATGLLIKIAAARQTRGQLRDRAAVAFPKAPHAITILTIPLRPEYREVANLITAWPEVPGLGDQLYL